MTEPTITIDVHLPPDTDAEYHEPTDYLVETTNDEIALAPYELEEIIDEQFEWGEGELYAGEERNQPFGWDITDYLDYDSLDYESPYD